MDKKPSSTIVLVIDGDPAVRNALKFSLEVEGFHVRTYANAAEILGEGALARRGYLVIDDKLPDRSGMALLTELRRAGCQLSAILIATNPTRALRSMAASARVRVIEKPLLTDELFEAIREGGTLAQD